MTMIIEHTIVSGGFGGHYLSGWDKDWAWCMLMPLILPNDKAERIIKAAEAEGLKLPLTSSMSGTTYLKDVKDREDFCLKHSRFLAEFEDPSLPIMDPAR